MTVVDDNTFTLTFSGHTWQLKQRFDIAGAAFYEPATDTGVLSRESTFCDCDSRLEDPAFTHAAQG